MIKICIRNTFYDSICAVCTYYIIPVEAQAKEFFGVGNSSKKFVEALDLLIISVHA